MTVEDLVQHARRYGPEGVLYTGHAEGLAEEELLVLARRLDALRCERAAPRAKPLTTRQLEIQVRDVRAYLQGSKSEGHADDNTK